MTAVKALRLPERSLHDFAWEQMVKSDRRGIDHAAVVASFIDRPGDKYLAGPEHLVVSCASVKYTDQHQQIAVLIKLDHVTGGHRERRSTVRNSIAERNLITRQKSGACQRILSTLPQQAVYLDVTPPAIALGQNDGHDRGKSRTLAHVLYRRTQIDQKVAWNLVFPSHAQSCRRLDGQFQPRAFRHQGQIIGFHCLASCLSCCGGGRPREMECRQQTDEPTETNPKSELGPKRATFCGNGRTPLRAQLAIFRANGIVTRRSNPDAVCWSLILICRKFWLSQDRHVREVNPAAERNEERNNACKCSQKSLPRHSIASPLPKPNVSLKYDSESTMEQAAQKTRGNEAGERALARPSSDGRHPSWPNRSRSRKRRAAPSRPSDRTAEQIGNIANCVESVL